MDNMLTNLKTVIFSVMEQLFFLLPGESDEDADTVDLKHVAIGISGSPSYLVTLEVDRELAITMAENLLGLDEDDIDDEVIENNLRETANIVGGNFLLSFDDEPDRNVTLPGSSMEDIFPGGKAVESMSLGLGFDGKTVKATLDKIG